MDGLGKTDVVSFLPENLGDIDHDPQPWRIVGAVIAGSRTASDTHSIRQLPRGDNAGKFKEYHLHGGTG
jgi:hypothetical protein